MRSYCTALRRALQVVVQARPVAAGVERWLEAQADRRPDQEQAAR